MKKVEVITVMVEDDPTLSPKERTMDRVQCPNPKCINVDALVVMGPDASGDTYYCQHCRTIFTIRSDLMEKAEGHHNCKNCDHIHEQDGRCTCVAIPDEPEDVGNGLGDDVLECFCPIDGWPMEAN